MQPEKNLNFLFRIFLYSFYCFLKVIFSRRAGNYIHAALVEVSRVNVLEKSQRRLEKENKKRLKQGIPPLAVPKNSEEVELTEPEEAHEKVEEKIVEESKPIEVLQLKGPEAISIKDEKSLGPAGPEHNARTTRRTPHRGGSRGTSAGKSKRASRSRNSNVPMPSFSRRVGRKDGWVVKAR